MNIKRVLLADDDADDREIFERVLGKKDDVLLMQSVENGKEVIDYLGKITSEGLPHLIILDHNMPKMNGTETLEFLKSSPRYAGISVVIYSTYSDNRLKEKCLELGAAMVLSKPSSLREYEAIIDKFLGIISGNQTTQTQ
jgi:CheY-like chemotaxis protein